LNPLKTAAAMDSGGRKDALRQKAAWLDAGTWWNLVTLRDAR